MDNANAILSVIVGLIVVVTLVWDLIGQTRRTRMLHDIHLQASGEGGVLESREIRPYLWTGALMFLRGVWTLFVVVYVGTVLVSVTKLFIDGNVSLQALGHALLLDELWKLIVQNPFLVIPVGVVAFVLIGAGYMASRFLAKRAVDELVRKAVTESVSNRLILDE